MIKILKLRKHFEIEKLTDEQVDILEDITATIRDRMFNLPGRPINEVIKLENEWKHVIDFYRKNKDKVCD